MSALIREKETTTEPLLTGDLNERFYKAVHEKPVLYYDVIRTGVAAINQRTENGFTVSDGKMPYEIVLLHGENVNDAVLGKMMALQDSIARHAGPHEANAIDYKSESEIIAHYVSGGLGIGIFAATGDLIGQTLISFKNDETTKNKLEANIGWLMVDPTYRKNLLCENIILTVLQIAKSSETENVTASVRIHNQNGVAKFAAQGFLVQGTGQNEKDGSINLKFSKQVRTTPTVAQESYPRPITLDMLTDEQNREILNRLAAEDMVAQWDFTKKWLTVHKLVTNKPKLVKISLGL